MDAITKTPGLQHISEEILQLLDKKSLMNCRLVNSSWKNVMNQPTFWITKMEREEIPEDVPRSWKMLAQELNDDQLSNEFVLILNKLMKSNQKKIEKGFGSFLGYFFTWFTQNGKSLPDHSMVQPLEIVVELKEANKYPDLMKFILEHVDPNSKVDVKISGKMGNGISRNLNPIQLAALYGLTESVEKLKLRYDSPDIKTKRNESLIYLAIFYGHLETIKVLANFIAVATSRDSISGSTEIMYAAYVGRLDIVQFLTEHTDNPLIPSNQGFTPIHLASGNDILMY